MSPGQRNFSDEELGYALKLLKCKFDSPGDLINFWIVAGKSHFPGPRIEQLRPWTTGLTLI